MINSTRAVCSSRVVGTPKSLSVCVKPIFFCKSLTAWTTKSFALHYFCNMSILRSKDRYRQSPYRQLQVHAPSPEKLANGQHDLGYIAACIPYGDIAFINCLFDQLILWGFQQSLEYPHCTACFSIVLFSYNTFIFSRTSEMTRSVGEVSGISMRGFALKSKSRMRSSSAIHP